MWHTFSRNTRYLDDEIEQRRQRLKKRALARQVHEAEELLEIEEEQEKKEDASSSEYETEYESEEDEGPRLKPVFVRQKGTSGKPWTRTVQGRPTKPVCFR